MGKNGKRKMGEVYCWSLHEDTWVWRDMNGTVWGRCGWWLNIGARRRIILPIVMCTSDVNIERSTTVMNVCVMEMNPKRGACVSWLDGEGYEAEYESFGIVVTAKGVDYRVAEWVHCGTLRWFGVHVNPNLREFYTCVVTLTLLRIYEIYLKILLYFTFTWHFMAAHSTF